MTAPVTGGTYTGIITRSHQDEECHGCDKPIQRHAPHTRLRIYAGAFTDAVTIRLHVTCRQLKRSNLPAPKLVTLAEVPPQASTSIPTATLPSGGS